MMLLRFGFVVLVFFRLFAFFTSVGARFRGEKMFVGDEPIEFSVSRNGKSKTIGRVVISVELPDEVHFRVRAENKFDRFAKWLGIADELQTKDERFDQAVYVVSDDAVLFSLLAGDAVLREEILQLVSANCSVQCLRGKLLVEMDNRGFDYSQSNQDVARVASGLVLQTLLKIRTRIKASGAQIWSSDRDPRERLETFLLTLTSILGMAGVVAFFYGLGEGMPRQIVRANIERYGVEAGLATSIVFILLLIVALRVCSRTHLILMEVILIGLPSAWFISDAAFDWSNRALDHSPEVVTTVTIESKYTTRNRHSTSYFVVIHNWPDERAIRHFSVQQPVYNAVAGGDCVQIVLHDGRFHDPWISSFRPMGNSCE
jgi:hypothetical protein